MAPNEEPTPAAPAQRPRDTAWTRVVTYLKDARDIIVAIGAIVTAAVFALNYFATSRALECFKAESKRSDELVQTILQINDLAASWQLSNVQLEQLDLRRKDPSVLADNDRHDAVIKDLSQVKVQLDGIKHSLDAARVRKATLEQTDKPCE